MQNGQFAGCGFCRNLVGLSDGRNQKFQLFAEQVNALHILCGNAGNRCDGAVFHALVDPVNSLFLGELLAGEEFFKEFLVSFRNCLGECLNQTVYPIA